MSRGTLITFLLFGIIAFSAAAIPPLTRIRLRDEAAECARRRAALAAGVVQRWEVRVCPRGNRPYFYELGPDSAVVARCPNGHGEIPLPPHVWVDAP